MLGVEAVESEGGSLEVISEANEANRYVLVQCGSWNMLSQLHAISLCFDEVVRCIE